MNQQAQRPDPRKLLEAFVNSSRSERAFTALVACLSGLVYSSALRRTGNAQLAEEVAQNVFAIKARKASSLLGHPSLEAWTLETTRLEAAAVMRSEKRRQRKLSAYTRARARSLDKSGHRLARLTLNLWEVTTSFSEFIPTAE